MKKLFKCILAVALMFTCSVNPVWAADSQSVNNTVVDVKDQNGNDPTDYDVIFDATVEIAGVDVTELEKDNYSLLTNDVLVAKNENGDQVDTENVTVTFEVPNLVAGTIEVYGNSGEGWDLLDATINVESKTITATFAKLPAEIAIMYAEEVTPSLDVLINTYENKDIVSILGVSSEADGLEGAGLGTAAATLDYNTNTYWHSRWPDADGQVHWISYDLGDVYDLSGISFLPRINSDYINGDLFEIKVYVSMDENFDENDVVGNFAFDYAGHMLVSRDFHDAVFNKVTPGRYVKVQAVHTGGDTGNDKFASMNEIRFYGVESDYVEPVNKETLVATITSAEAINAEDYTEETYAVLAAAIEAAKTVNENADATQVEVDAAVEAIEAAIEGLKEVTPPVDKAALAAAIEAAKAIDASKYTDASIAALASALTAAEVVNTNEDATQEQVDAAVAALEAAIEGLKEKEEPKVMDFYDVQDKSAWFYGSVEKAFQLGLMGATGKEPVEGKPFFEPDTNISRGMVATVLYRMAGMPTVTYTARFTDVENNLWYTNAIEWAAGATIVNGYGNTGEFGPDDNITRQDLAIMLRNYATKQAGLDGAATVDFSSFKDGSVVDAYAASAVAWCVENGIMSGSVKADGTYLMPKANATRAECAKMFSLLAEK